MRRLRCRLPAIMGMALGLAAGMLWCAPRAFPQVVLDEIIAKVNSDIILKSDLTGQERTLIGDGAAQLRQQGASDAQIQAYIDSEKPNLLRNLIEETLLVQKAGEYGIESEANLQVLRTMDLIREDNNFDTMEDLEAAIIAQGDTPESVREGIRRQYLTAQVINREVRSRIVITTEEQRAYYDAHLEEFDQPRGINLAEIVKVIGGLTQIQQDEIRDEMEAIHARLVDGEDFFQIAMDESDSSTANDGGVLGYFGDGQLGPEYQEAADKLKRNEISDVFEVQDALVIVKLLDRHEGGILPFDLARRQLDSLLMSQKEGPRIREYLDKLRRDSFIWVREGYVDTGALPPEADSPETASPETASNGEG